MSERRNECTKHPSLDITLSAVTFVARSLNFIATGQSFRKRSMHKAGRLSQENKLALGCTYAQRARQKGSRSDNSNYQAICDEAYNGFDDLYEKE